jgi:hypothetical protein
MTMTDVAPAGLGHNNPPALSLRERLLESSTELLRDVDQAAAAATRLPTKVSSDDDLGACGDAVRDARAVLKRVKQAKTSEKEPFLQGGREVDAFFAVPTERLDRVIATLEERCSEYQRAKAAEARRLAEEEARRARDKADAERRRAREAAAGGRVAVAARAEDRAQAADERAERAERDAAARAADLTRSRSASGTLATARQTWRGEIINLANVDLEKLRPFIKREAIEAALNAFVRINKGAVEVAGCRIFEDIRAAFR